MYKILIALMACMLAGSAFSQDKSNDVLLVHAATEQTGSGYSYSSDSTLKYTAEYLWGFLSATEGFNDAQVDYDSEPYAHSLADIYYDPVHSDLKAQIGSGYRFVILFDSDQAYAYPEVLYEGCKQLSDLALEAGSTPMMMMASSEYVGPITLGDYAYRAANGSGVEVIPGTYAMKAAGMQKDQTAENVARQAWIAACTIYRKITGLDPADTSYTPTYQHFDYYVNEDYGYDSRWPIESSDLVALTTYANDAVIEQDAAEHYNTSYELDGSVLYRYLDLSQAPYNGELRYFFKGTSTHLFTRDRLNTYVSESIISSATHYGRIVNDSRFWNNADTIQRTGSLTNATNLNRGAFLYASESESDAYAQDLTNLNGEQLIPMVFDWIKAFDGASGTAATTNALNNQDCADLWDDYFYRGWKTIPLTVGMGRLNEALPQFSASDDDGGHTSDPLFYMNASMMVASALGQEFPIPEGTLPTRRGTWSHAELSTAIELGHDLVKELAYLSETSSYVPDSDLSITTNALPNLPPNGSYSHQLAASGGVGGYLWELLPDTSLPTGLSLSVNGLLHGTVAQTGTWNVAFKVTDNMGSFRKVGFTLSSGTAEAVDFTVQLASYDPAAISLPGDDSGDLTYGYSSPANGALSGTAPDLTYTPNAGITSDSFTYTITSGGVASDTKTVTIQMVLPDGLGVGAPDAYSTDAEVDEDGSVAIPLTGFDAQGDSLMARIISAPAHGSIVSLTGNVATYEPGLDFYGSDSFIFKLNDGVLDSAMATISITVNPVNDAVPVAEALSEVVTQNSTLAITLSASDFDGDSLVYSVVSGPSYGSLSGTVPNLTYTPASGYTGTDSFTYKANDGYGDSEEVTVTITVAVVPEITVAVNESDYHLTGAEVTGFRSTGVQKSLDADSDDVYGSDGYFFYGNGSDNSSNSDATPSWVTSVEVANSVVVNGAYTDFDNPTASISETVSDWTSTGICTFNNGSAGTWSELFSFTIDETAPPHFRLGVMAGNEGNTDGRWDPAGIRVSSMGIVATASGLDTDLGMVFFDIIIPDGFSGTFSIEGQTRDVATDKGPTMAGVVFDFDYPLVFDNPPADDVTRVNVAYSNSVVGSASDLDGDTLLSYSAQSGPSWLVVAADGSLNGVPSSSDVGANSWVIEVSDESGDSATTVLNIAVVDSVLIGYDFDSDAVDWSAASIVPTGIYASQFTSPMAIAHSTTGDATGLDAVGGEFGTTSTLGSVGVQTVDATTTSFSAALAGDDYMSFTITPEADVKLNLTAMSFKVSLKSPNSVDEYVVTDAQGNLIDEPAVITTDEAQGTFGTFNTVTVNLIGSVFETITEATEFRIYAWGRGTSATSNTLALVDKVALYGRACIYGTNYSTWASGYSLTGDGALTGADVENGATGDGYSNLLEFALGMDPTVNDAGSSEANYTENDSGSEYFVYEYERRIDYLEQGLSYSLIVTPDLLNPSGESPYDVLIDNSGGDYETVKTRFQMINSAKFIQLQVEME
ncbi:Ig-like domain-containing protein [Rubritalea sp.]|uniref:Ig-like domain-containing protein n=1 Tax=Rubritalea sp. TaxID=2109375 RepID=UPI003EF33DF3